MTAFHRCAPSSHKYKQIPLMCNVNIVIVFVLYIIELILYLQCLSIIYFDVHYLESITTIHSVIMQYASHSLATASLFK